MDHEVDDTLGDPLDREIEALLAVEPPPEFLARVRTRVASETIGRRWRMLPRAWSFQPLLAAGVAAIVLAVVIPSWLRPDAPAVEQPRAAVTLPVQQPAELVQLKPDTTREPDTTTEIETPDRDARGGRLQAARQPRADAPPFPEVLVSESEQRGFAMLLASIEQRRLPPVPAPLDAGQSLEPPAIVIPELVIEPLPQIAALE